MNGIPRGVDPRNFVGEKFEEVENAGNADDPWVSKDLERLILRRQSDPMEMDGEPGHEDRELEIAPRQCSKTERDSEDIELFHGRTIQRS